MLTTLTHRLEKPRTLHFLFVALLLMACAGRSHGQVIAYTNVSTSSANPTQNFTGILSMAQSFTPAASGQITSISLNLSTISPNNGPVYDVQLWSNSGTSLPTTLLANFVTDHHWNTDRVTPPDSSHLVTFSSAEFSANYSLTAGTTYWLVIATTDGPNKSWGVSSTAGGPAAAYSLSTHQWETLSTSGALGMAVSVIPEPSTYAALGGIAVLGFAVYARRRSSRAAQVKTTALS